MSSAFTRKTVAYTDLAGFKKSWTLSTGSSSRQEMLMVSLHSQGNRAFENQGLKRLRQHTDEEMWEMSWVGHIICYGRLKDKRWKVRVKRVGLVIAISMLWNACYYIIHFIQWNMYSSWTSNHRYSSNIRFVFIKWCGFNCFTTIIFFQYNIRTWYTFSNIPTTTAILTVASTIVVVDIIGSLRLLFATNMYFWEKSSFTSSPMAILPSCTMAILPLSAMAI